MIWYDIRLASLAGLTCLLAILTCFSFFVLFAYPSDMSYISPCTYMYLPLCNYVSKPLYLDVYVRTYNLDQEEAEQSKANSLPPPTSFCTRGGKK